MMRRPYRSARLTRASLLAITLCVAGVLGCGEDGVAPELLDVAGNWGGA